LLPSRKFERLSPRTMQAHVKWLGTVEEEIYIGKNEGCTRTEEEEDMEKKKKKKKN